MPSELKFAMAISKEVLSDWVGLLKHRLKSQNKKSDDSEEHVDYARMLDLAEILMELEDSGKVTSREWNDATAELFALCKRDKEGIIPRCKTTKKGRRKALHFKPTVAFKF